KYEVAIVEFEKAVPTTERGVKLKLRLLRSRDQVLAEGDVLTFLGHLHRARYVRTIDVALSRLTAGDDQDEPAQPGPAPTPTPGRGAARWRRKSPKRFS